MSNCNPTPEQQIAFDKLREVSSLLINAGWTNIHAQVPATKFHIKWKMVLPVPCPMHSYWIEYFTKKECGRYCPDCGELLKPE